MKRLATTLTALSLLVVLAAPGGAITFTGNESDFPPSALLEDDGVDTETFACGVPPDLPLDIGRVYVANDNTYLYIGFTYNRACFCDMNLGVAFNTQPGGTAADAFARQIDWSGAADPPDFYLYDVIPTPCNGFNYEVLYKSNGAGGWNTVQDGPNGLGIIDADTGNFVEIQIELVMLELTGCNQVIGLEFWTTQEGGTKPAFDMVANDNEQRSTPGGTCFDVGPCPPSMPRIYLPYTIDCPVPVEPSTWGSIKNLYR